MDALPLIAFLVFIFAMILMSELFKLKREIRKITNITNRLKKEVLEITNKKKQE